MVKTRSKTVNLKSGSIEELTWLEKAGLQELIDRYPREWEAVGGELTASLAEGRIDKLNDQALKAAAAAALWKGRLHRDSQNPKLIEQALPQLRRSRLWLLALEQCALAAATGRASGKIRFKFFNGLLIQKLLFRQGLERKPVSLTGFRFCWPLISQKRLLMPLVQSRGIFCFYSKKLVTEMAALIAGRSCLEIAAGDGTLSRFLTEAGVPVRPTDDYSWTHVIDFPERVEKRTAAAALKRYRPQAVICSWPPPGNPFEQEVFSTPSVELYLVVGSRHAFASGNRQAYENRKNFDLEISQRLSRYVLPPELDSAVLIFRRKPC
ncbi:MAG: SAM-dependent methyltransferase [Deltaproteobacteria bacterium]|nr:SAM-dependent methyltransferase [Deltaproteobacteria bacterium]